ncbi:helix-turn-helix domain-containing protein [Enterobacter roggenkampii]|uniref:helix-turn-helix domain-containing protein n=1 Tax=Enterobacter roggenkampii TaxID=1812935 RepID=UPI001237F11A|nr:helix-turn-helix domain-containing protein [Enterobacter roggenkampii]
MLNSSTPFPMVKKPLADFQIIIDALRPFANLLSNTKKKKLPLVYSGKPVCYLILEGNGAVFRNLDSIIIGNTRAPSLFGLTNVLFPLRDEYYWKTEENSLVMIIDAHKVREIISKENLWQHFAVTLAYYSYHLNENHAKLTANSSLDMIYLQIYSFMQEPIEIQLKNSLTKYILERTFISRSYVMKIVSELKAANLIVFNGKFLVHIDSSLTTNKARLLNPQEFI